MSGVTGRLAADRFVDLADETPVTRWIDPRTPTDDAWDYVALWERIREALFALPAYFQIDAGLPAIPATDLHAANTLLGAVIEDSIPKTLNQLRTLWDADRRFSDWEFHRQPQTFPDVVFRRVSATGVETMFGIEIKSSYALAKEAEPSFRFNVNRNFCHPADLCAIYPWALSAAVAGKPTLFRPLVCGARKAARLREESWLQKAQDDAWRQIDKPLLSEAKFHPTREDRINDTAPRDSGNNMGRLARTGIWTAELNQLMAEERISGIPLIAWQKFLAAFSESTSLETALREIARIPGVAASAADLSRVAGEAGDKLIELAARLAEIPAEVALAPGRRPTRGRRREGGAQALEPEDGLPE